MLKKICVLSLLLCATQSFADPVCAQLEMSFAAQIESSNRVAILFNECSEQVQIQGGFDNQIVCTRILKPSGTSSPQSYNQMQMSNLSFYQYTLNQYGCSTSSLPAPNLANNY